MCNGKRRPASGVLMEAPKQATRRRNLCEPSGLQQANEAHLLVRQTFQRARWRKFSARMMQAGARLIVVPGGRLLATRVACRLFAGVATACRNRRAEPLERATRSACNQQSGIGGERACGRTHANETLEPHALRPSHCVAQVRANNMEAVASAPVRASCLSARPAGAEMSRRPSAAAPPCKLAAICCPARADSALEAARPA